MIYKFHKQIKGGGNYAIIELFIEKSNSRNIITENYSKEETDSKLGYVTNKGFNDWKKSALDGLNKALRLTDKEYAITINSVQGHLAHTNPEVICYTAFLAICCYLNRDRRGSKDSI